MIAAGIAATLSAVGIGQAIAGWIAVRRFVTTAGRNNRVTALVPVTVLKPLYGHEPLLKEALTTVCQQDYPAYQIVFGISDAEDAAIPVLRDLQQRFPDRDITVVVDRTVHGANGKVANLINMLSAAKHDVLVIADSDVHAASDWLLRLVAALQAPDVGLVTTVYTGLPVRGIVAALGALQINQYFLPGALLARAMGREDCLGATMALRRETLERIGGFRALVNHLADDNVLGRLVQRLGLKVALADTIPATTVPEEKLRELWRHELRWARTIRALVPAQFGASVLQYPLFWAALTGLAGGTLSLLWFAAVWSIRALAAHGIDRALGLANRSPLWLLPLRELMSVAVLIASYASRRVEWRGQTMQAEGFNPL